MKDIDILATAVIIAGVLVTMFPVPSEATLVVTPGPEPEPQPQPTTAEAGLPQPLNKVVMNRSLGHHWHRTLPETRWWLVSVTFDVNNWFPYPIHLDKAIVEVAGQVEEVPLDIWLRPGETRIESVQVSTIRDIETGSYPLSVSLESNGEVMCSRVDIAEVYPAGEPLPVGSL